MRKTKTVDFGAPDEFGGHIFRVEIPDATSGVVKIIEDYGLRGGEGSIPYEIVRAILRRQVWNAISSIARQDFNLRLKSKKLITGRWKPGTTKVDRLLGKELCVLAWAAELGEKRDWPIICQKWSALRPEERWWLYHITAAEAGSSDDQERGWRKALFCALSDGEAINIKKTREKKLDNDLDLERLQLTLNGFDEDGR